MATQATEESGRVFHCLMRVEVMLSNTVQNMRKWFKNCLPKFP